ncbi:MAG TPA: hypothetical protein VL424_12385 [Pararobbsia sp.]|nr:hypothetical protein [Pararobbsia sp.]
MKDEFGQFVRDEIANLDKQGGPVDAEKERLMWLAKLDVLYALVRRSLKRYIDNGTIDFTLTETTLDEEWLGKYTVQRGTIYLGRKVVRLEPLGTIHPHSRGRVHLDGPRGVARFLLVPPDALYPRVRQIFPPIHGVLDPNEPPDPPPESWVWKIAIMRPSAYIDLAHDNFRETLMGVIRG